MKLLFFRSISRQTTPWTNVTKNNELGHFCIRALTQFVIKNKTVIKTWRQFSYSSNFLNPKNSSLVFFKPEILVLH